MHGVEAGAKLLENLDEVRTGISGSSTGELPIDSGTLRSPPRMYKGKLKVLRGVRDPTMEHESIFWRGIRIIVTAAIFSRVIQSFRNAPRTSHICADFSGKNRDPGSRFYLTL